MTPDLLYDYLFFSHIVRALKNHPLKYYEMLHVLPARPHPPERFS